MQKKKQVKAKKGKITDNAAPVESYKHKDKRAHIPTQEESIKLTAKQKQPVKKKYDYDPSMDPQLIWAGKKEAGAEFGVATVPIYVQENIAPESIIARLKNNSQAPTQFTLFGDTAQQQMDKAVEFYKHEDNWENRMILGDSLLVMNSLLEKEGMRGKTQTIFIDPPYGIKFGSNWQVSTRKMEVKDNKEDDLIRQPEQVKAFRDTWELGIHSYLTYLRERLMISRELLNESGSCFIQINDENVHLIRNLMDEVFGVKNFVSQIPFVTTSGFASKYIDSIADYIVWYAKDIETLKYRQLYKEKIIGLDGSSGYDFIELPDGTEVKASEYRDKIPKGARFFAKSDLLSKGPASEVQTFIFEGKKYTPNQNSHWKAEYPEGMKRLVESERVVVTGNTLRYKRYFDDFPMTPISNSWAEQLSEQNKTYVVQTTTEVIKRCILMSSDPGDLVVDPTCGSGTTAFVCEMWGRRWITIDTSRVALALARSRIMTAKLPYFDLKDDTNISMGFNYITIPHITLKSISRGENADAEILYDKPFENKVKIRVSGPFTVESLAPHRVSDAQELIASERFVETVIDNVLKAGVQTGQKGARLEFENLEVLPSGPEIQAIGEYKTKQGLKKAALAIGPEFGSIDDDFIIDAVKVAKKFADLLVVAATSFDGSASSVSAEIDGVRVMKVKINPDLSMGDLLKKTGAGNMFLAFGEPEVKVHKSKEGLQVEILGVDVYDPVKGEIRSSGEDNLDYDIAAWFIDSNYNGEAFFVTHAYFLGEENPYEKLKKALKADIPEELWDELNSTISRHFPKPTTGKIAVKVINHYGDEVMKVIQI